ncbi:MAG TPA: hypothetical protein VLE91_03985 [Candidatus Saccharimonadales bacterium]|nr:hypothetical protein [Candidatus Saccharimonadales bacterium]
MPAKQLEVVSGVDSFEAYSDFSYVHFSDEQLTANWLVVVSQGLDRLHPDVELSEYFKLLALTSIETAQYGFAQQIGQSYRHARDQHSLPVTEPSHQLAILRYMADLNVQAHPVKEAMFEILSEEKPHVAMAAWGVSLRASGGKMKRDPLKDRRGFKSDATERAYSPRPICVADLDFNSKLAEISFSAKDAESMSNADFKRCVYPQVRAVLSGIVNTDAVFA